MTLPPIPAEKAFPDATCRVCGKPPGFDCRAHFVAENLELRGELEAALILLDRFAGYAHDEECATYNACENGDDDDGPCRFDEDADEMVHNHGSCRCGVWDAASRAANIRLVLTTTLGKRWDRSAKATHTEDK